MDIDQNTLLAIVLIVLVVVVLLIAFGRPYYRRRYPRDRP